MLQDQTSATQPAPSGSAEASSTALVDIMQTGDMEISPALAVRLLTECQYERQRQQRSYRVAYLAREMEAGYFLPAAQVIAFALLGPKLYLVNGQHTLSAIVKTGLTLTMPVRIIPVHSFDEIGPLYWKFDSQGVRSWRDAVRAANVRSELTESQAAKVVSAMLLIQTGFRHPTQANFPTEAISKDARFQAAKSWWPAAGHYFELIEPASVFMKVRLSRQAVLAVALVTLRHQPEKSVTFWSGIARDDGLRRDDPRKVFIRFLAENTAGGVGSPINQARAAAQAWNAHFAGETRSIIRLSPESPIVIAGTPIGRTTRRK